LACDNLECTLPDTSLHIVNNEINQWTHYMANIKCAASIYVDEKISANLDYLYYHVNNPVNYFISFFDKEGSLVFEEQTKSGKTTPIHIWVASLDFSKKLSKKIKMDAGIKGSSSKFTNNVLIERLIQNSGSLIRRFLLNTS
jgi:hypothetical protein